MLKDYSHSLPMLQAKGKCCINNSSDDFRIIGKEKGWHLIRLEGKIFINHFKPALNRKEGIADLALFTQ